MSNCSCQLRNAKRHSLDIYIAENSQFVLVYRPSQNYAKNDDKAKIDAQPRYESDALILESGK